MLQVSRLFVYPIKSLGGVELTTAEVTDRGFKYDRRWMLVDVNNRFLSQRERAQMALLRVSITGSGLVVTHASSRKQLTVPFEPKTTETGLFTIWDDTCAGVYVSAEADAWFSDILDIDCRLVYMPDDSLRMTDPVYTPGKINSFSDGYPFLIIGQASLDELNGRLNESIPMNRFRPNIVFTGGEAFEEDTMARFTISNIQFTAAKLCARCNIPTIDQDTAMASKEPTRTLATYRRRKNNVYFGQNLVAEGEGFVSVGDMITVSEIREMKNSLTAAQNA